MKKRYVFLCPDRTTASGGIAVIYDAVTVLRAAGHNAVILHNDAQASYPDYHPVPPILYTHEYRRAAYRYFGRLARRREPLKLWFERFKKGKNQQFTLQNNDVLIVPEFMMAVALEAFPLAEIGVFVQNPFSFRSTYLQALDRALDIGKRISWYLGVSEICQHEFELLGLDKTSCISVTMKPDDFPYHDHKMPLITFMPRKRPEEGRVLELALKNSPALKQYHIAKIDNLPRADVARMMRDSLVFVSLMEKESIGFPAAEAMVSGCIAVGYTGLGGAEYFTPETGVPVPDGDLYGLVRAVEATILEYERSPARLDSIRRRAHDLVSEKFSRTGFEQSLLNFWDQLEAQATPMARTENRSAA